jgi:hypothetical protein
MRSDAWHKHRPRQYYQLTLRLMVTDEQALRSAANELAEAIEPRGWKDSRRSIRDDLFALLDPGHVPGVRIIETVLDPVLPHA